MPNEERKARQRSESEETIVSGLTRNKVIMQSTVVIVLGNISNCQAAFAFLHTHINDVINIAS